MLAASESQKGTAAFAADASASFGAALAPLTSWPAAWSAIASPSARRSTDRRRRHPRSRRSATSNELAKRLRDESSKSRPVCDYAVQQFNGDADAALAWLKSPAADSFKPPPSKRSDQSLERRGLRQLATEKTVLKEKQQELDNRFEQLIAHAQQVRIHHPRSPISLRSHYSPPATGAR